jgi:hypothetical protein
LRILALDFDRKGGAVLSGIGRPGAVVTILCDDTPRGRGVVDADGRFALAFDEPLPAGAHRLAAVEGADRARVSMTAAPAAPLVNQPFRAGRELAGWRIDWLTPGGGVQTTLLLSQEAPA